MPPIFVTSILSNLKMEDVMERNKKKTIGILVIIALLIIAIVLIAVKLFTGTSDNNNGNSVPSPTPLASSLSSSDANSNSININGNDEGRTFEGIGAISAGASSRLLTDYPQKQQSEILDYLFKPNYGASFHQLKVEIGGDMNSTDGTEPSFARTLEEFNNPKEEYFNRGYEYWLMKQAKQRNSGIYLDAIEWGAPGWIVDTFTENNIKYVIKFIQGAKTYHNLNIDFIGIREEKTNYTPAGLDYIKNLRAALDNNNLANVKIVGVDSVNSMQSSDLWAITGYIKNDEELKNAIAAIGVHYPSMIGNYLPKDKGLNYKDNTDSQNIGIPLYSSEDGPWAGDWEGAKAIARINNKNYIFDKITKTEYWCPVTSYYDVLPVPGAGVMLANTPWSGYYNVQPALWAVAHTTQFAQPEWKYVESGCGLIDDGDGSYVTLKASDGSGDYSIIAETTVCTKSQTLTFNISNLSSGTIHVWKSNEDEQFVKEDDITPANGSFTITLEAGSIYSLTTTTGQMKGGTAAPPESSFPANYSDDFESYSAGATPKYFQDQGGAFEVYQYEGETKSLRQVITSNPISWCADPFPFTIIGDMNWTDYDVSVKALIEGSQGQAGILGRISAVGYFEMGSVPNGYVFNVNEAGEWTLYKKDVSITKGTVPLSKEKWHKLKLSFKGDSIKAYIDDKIVADVNDSTYSSGMAGLTTGWNNTRFDDFTVANTGS